MIAKIKSFIKKNLPPRISMPLKEILSAPLVFDSIKRDLNSFMNLRKISGKNQKDAIKNSEFKIYSQNSEDGIISYIFSKIGTSNKKLVEFGIEDGRECNTANLIINNGWHGLLMDGNPKSVAEARYYYEKKPYVMPGQIKIVNCFVTKDNINKILSGSGISGEIDLLSLDIDGNDYWVWNEIDVIKPRVVVIEYNASFGDDKSISVKYDPSFERYKKHSSGYYYGASLAAFAKLGKSKGYVLIGCDSAGCNAFFVRKDAARNKFRELSVKEAYYPIIRRLKIESTEDQFKRVSHLEFVKV